MRIRTALAVLAAGSAMALVPLLGSVTAVQAQTAHLTAHAVKASPLACGGSYISSAATSGDIEGDGVNSPVLVLPAGDGGNCFTKVFSGSGWNEWQNGDDHCLFNNGGTLELGGACVDNHVNEEMHTPGYGAGTNELYATSLEPNTYAPAPCSVGNTDEVQGTSSTSCNAWVFSSSP